MKRQLIRNATLVCFLVTILSLTSCKSREPEESEMDESFFLKTDKNLKNSGELEQIKKKISIVAINELSKEIQLAMKKDPLDASRFNSKDVGVIVSLKAEVAKLFDPEGHPCSLPSKIAKKLRNAKEDGKPWAPKFVVNHISQMPDSVIYIPRESISNILHRVTVRKNGTITSFPWLVATSPTYNNLNVEDFILTGFNSFFYSLDCSGYLNAAIEGSAAVPGADIKTAAKSSLETQNSMFIGGGVIVSPLYAAYSGKLISMDTVARINILRALLDIENTTDNDVIEMGLSFNAVWASKIGTSSFNGKADLKTGAGIGIGVAQISSSVNGGGAISRKSAFSSFNTYITKEQPLESPGGITIAKIKSVLQALTQKK